MTSRTSTILAVATALAITGCAKKPKQLPPPPPETTQPSADNGMPSEQSSQVSSTIVPGSRDDFLQKAGTDTIRFALDSIDLDADSRATLDGQAQWLQQYRNVRATIEGHCDERGTREYNLALGDRRANAAKNYLVGKGIDASRLATISYGKERPVATGSDEASWAQNRRAVTVVPVAAGAL